MGLDPTWGWLLTLYVIASAPFPDLLLLLPLL